MYVPDTRSIIREQVSNGAIMCLTASFCELLPRCGSTAAFCHCALCDFCWGGTRWGGGGGGIVPVPRVASRSLLIGQAVTLLRACETVLSGSVGRGIMVSAAMASEAGRRICRGFVIFIALSCVPFYRWVVSTWRSSALETCFIAFRRGYSWHAMVGRALRWIGSWGKVLW